MRRKNCRGCFSTRVTCFLDFGKMPLSGAFLSRTLQKDEIKYPLKVFFCHRCGLVQIFHVIDPEVLFKTYFYSSSVIPSLYKHFQDYAEFLKKNYLRSGSQLLEFGSNDGVLLENFKKSDIHAIGVDPSENVSKIAKKKGLNVIVDYFNKKCVKKIFNTYGQMDVVTGSNVFAHIDNIHEVLESAIMLLKPDGVFIVEVHYLGDLIEDYQYDTIYHEHLSYYSLIALNNIFRLRNLKIIDVIRMDMHGGGIRVVAAKKGSNRKPSKRVHDLIKMEKEQKLDTLGPFMKFKEKREAHRIKLLKLLKNIKKKGKRIVGYGAPGRGVTLLNYCNIGKDYLDYVVDSSPLRIGKLMPGVHIPIYPPTKPRHNPPDYFLVLAWNYIESILMQESDLQSRGVEFIVPFPRIKVLPINEIQL